MLNLDTLGLAAKVTASGISAPDYQTILSKITDYYRVIYGSDAYLEPDSKDGQMIAIYALGIHDANNTAIAVYNSFSPATAQGRGLQSNVKINGITVHESSNSSCDVVLSGTVGTTISNGSVKDTNGAIWDLPDSVTIGLDGTVTETVICQTAGAIAALPGAINQINTPTRGWHAVTNASSATVGSPVETDSELRKRQSISVALPSVTTFEGLIGAISNIDGVNRTRLYENDTGVTDTDGLPPHSIAAIVAGGDVTEIATVIQRKKDQGTSTFGSTVVVVPDYYGNPKTIRFSRPVDIPVYVDISLKAFTGYTTQTAEDIKVAIAAYINTLNIGDDVLISRIYSPANLGVVSGGASRFYDILELKIGTSAGSTSATNITIPFDSAALCSIGNINITASS